ncbi:AfsR/SARP family transcriptional regulator [Actinomycetospora sp. NBRC 106378]|jgi:SARP family transcriptional regulator, regulator of embCAB operon|uniref:AfsR/SARP family transcriptional regulator n=1 Tax=Actinomycetospora sp. NBRC 106378 TaxID=3032208 RepID=UPI0024A0B3F0|nr:AfsR/SARP family transcriptional regulator [Actinomycetospora sp. NBRC 106378]GLZ55401.1 hypothetical protein Acsp07_50180 [Actinomycetospora sp. NBRC 106378]
MEIQVLGPLEARVNGRSILPTAAKPRQVLALLALHAGAVVPVSTIVDELWGENPPRSAQTTLQTYVMQLRRLLDAALAPNGRSAKDVLTTRFGGYMLDVDPECVDATEFARLAEAGRRAFDYGDHDAAARLLDEAQRLCRGATLVDVAVGLPLGMEITRLEETRLAALENRIEAELSLGRHQSLLGELSMLCARYPMNENLRAQQMLALYRSGRQWQALEVFGSLRATLVDELGVEPSARLQALQHRILDSDPALELRPAHLEPGLQIASSAS